MRLLFCDDHAIFRAGLRAILAPLGAEFFEVGTTDEALALLAREEEMDVILLDLDMPGDGWVALRRFRSDHPQVPVVIVSASEEASHVSRALESGAAGFIPKSSSAAVFRSALQLVLEGSVYLPPILLERSPGSLPRGARAAATSSRNGAPVLTGRQSEILVMMSRGLTNAEIGRVLGIAEGTVKAHVSAIFDALDVSNRTEAALVMRELGLEDD